MARLTSRFLVDLLLRKAASAGGFAAVIARGDDHSGAILIECRDRAIAGPLLERRFGPDGHHIWESVGPAPTNDSGPRREYLDRRRRADPDLWVLELDIADAPRFIADWALLT